MENIRIIDETGQVVPTTRSAFETQADPVALRLKAEMEAFRARKEIDSAAFIGPAAVSESGVAPEYQGFICA